MGGSETFTIETLTAIAANWPGIEMVLFTNRENHPCLKERFAAYDRVSLCRLNFRADNRFNRIIREQTELPFRARRAEIDVLWSPGCTAPALVHCPQVLTIYDMQFKTHPEDLTPTARQVTELLLKIGKHRCQKFLTLSEFAKQELIKYLNIPDTRIVVTPGAVNPKFAAKARDDYTDNVLMKILPDRDTPYILSVANSYPHKNLHTLVEAFSLVTDQIPHQLVIVGKPRRGEGQLQSALKKLKDGEGIIRVSGLTVDELNVVYQKARLFVFPSLYEGFGLPVLEALSSGLPVLTNRLASLPEVGGEYAQYVDEPTAGEFARKILETIAWDPAYRVKMTEGARNWARSFSWKTTAELTLQVLKSVQSQNN